MAKKKWIIFLCLAVVLLVGLVSGKLRFDRTHVQIGEENIPCDVTELILPAGSVLDFAKLERLTELSILDARAVSLTSSDYQQLQKLLPDCQILWNIPFQGAFISSDVHELTLSTLCEADLEVLTFFEKLEVIHGETVQDYALLMALKARYPQLDLHYEVVLNGLVYTQDFIPALTSLTINDADIQELSNTLPCFTGLKEIIFTGKAPDNEAIYQLMCDYPQITFQWELDLFGIQTSNMADTLILSGIPMESTDEIESYLKYFPKLTRVEMCDCGIPSDQMDVLAQKYSEIRFVWTIKIGNGTLRTDATAFIPFKLGYTLYKPLYDQDCTELKYCIDLECLDLGHMQLTDLSFLNCMPKMKYLIVVDMPCTDFSPLANLTELVYLEIFCTNFTDHELLLGMTKLEDLNIGTTPAKDVSALHQMPWLKRLWLPGVNLNEGQIKALYAALPDTRIVLYAEHSTASGWRDHKNYRTMRDLLDMFYMD